MTDRFLRIVESGELPALSVVWLSEPDWTAHQSPLGSEQHLAAIRSADENVGRIIEGLKRNKLWNEEILVVVCSDHGNETVRREIDVVGELVAAGLKRDRVSADIVMASQGTAGYIYFGPGCAEVERVASYLLRQDWVGDVFVGDDIEEIGLSRDNGLEVVFSMAASAETNEYGIPGSADLAIDPDISVSFLGYAHHGGLGRSEQAPFLMIAGAGFAEGSVSAARASPLDIAPTILRHHSMPCDGMDGRPLQNEMRSVR
jgi:arylsulfatase A-like enzyme